MSCISVLRHCYQTSSKHPLSQSLAAHSIYALLTTHNARSGEGNIALEELLMAQTTAKQMPLCNAGGRQIGTFLFDVREFREDAVEDEQVLVLVIRVVAIACPVPSCRGGACGGHTHLCQLDLTVPLVGRLHT